MVVFDFLHQSKVRLVVDMLVPLVSVYLVCLMLLLLHELSLEQLLQVGTLSFNLPNLLSFSFSTHSSLIFSRLYLLVLITGTNSSLR